MLKFANLWAMLEQSIDIDEWLVWLLKLFCAWFGKYKLFSNLMLKQLFKLCYTQLIINLITATKQLSHIFAAMFSV
jgi:hypothetical protein